MKSAINRGKLPPIEDRRSSLIIGLKQLVSDSERRGVPAHHSTIVMGLRRLLVADEARSSDG